MMPKTDRIRTLLFILVAATAMAGAREMHAKGDQHEIHAKGDEHETPAKGDELMPYSDPKTAKYEPIPNMPACATGAVVRGNPRFGPSWVLLKLESGCKVPWHWHTPNEDLVVISGQGNMEMKKDLGMKDGTSIPIAPGVFAALPSGHIHRANCSRACLLFSISDDAFDIHYVDANGEEITLEEALKAAVPAPKPNVLKKSPPKKN